MNDKGLYLERSVMKYSIIYLNTSRFPVILFRNKLSNVHRVIKRLKKQGINAYWEYTFKEDEENNHD